jgi:hypothetical protein
MVGGKKNNLNNPDSRKSARYPRVMIGMGIEKSATQQQIVIEKKHSI